MSDKKTDAKPVLVRETTTRTVREFDVDLGDVYSDGATVPDSALPKPLAPASTPTPSSSNEECD